MAHDRDVAGIRCLEVLALLPDYLDDDVDTATRTRIESHLVGCDWCERFGGAYVGTVQSLRKLLTSEEVPADIQNRLMERLQD